MSTPGINLFQSSWILDSRVTDHVFPSKSYFSSLVSIKPVSVKLPNNQYVFASYSGTIHLGNLTLYNALYVPDFFVHLISIQKLVTTLNCIVIFCEYDCIIV
uniref:Retrovirus-related Pol polyprotein from transposon TNT 1-94-like beta-barrel domain-containing protein n=1 Tax=Cajanus cajan TaxID=3821 RepID=A0A151TE78_CAJCA|nr:hypothetical protein KK1_011594 [Cajanus cajan]